MTGLARYARVVLAYNVGVVTWGAYVRATGSGAGCGSHWPLCNGTVVQRAAAMETLVEYSHRLTSGLALVAVVVLLAWVIRATRQGHPARTGAVLSLAFMISEALLGAGLVLFGLVANDASSIRAIVVAAHLVNTFLLLAALALTVWWTSGGPALSARHVRQGPWRLAVGAAAILAVSGSGAVTALGDTLFPAATLQEALRADISSTSHLLIRLRTIHPILAVMTTLFLATSIWGLAAGRPSPMQRTKQLSWLLGLQLAAGFINVLLLAPVWLQLVHLLLADLIWIVYVLLAADTLAESSHSAVAPAAVPRPA